jgi:hypothetical protein
MAGTRSKLASPMVQTAWRVAADMTVVQAVTTQAKRSTAVAVTKT